MFIDKSIIMSSNSSSMDYILLLNSIQKNIFRFGGPILMCMGNVGSILSLIVFTKKNLRKNPCSIYLIVSNIANLVVLNLLILIMTQLMGYDNPIAPFNLEFCRSGLYMGFVMDILCPFYLILASIDRLLVTSSNARIRQRSTRRLAYICIIGGTSFWFLLHLHVLFFATLIEVGPNTFICYFNNTIYLIITAYYQLIVKGICVPLILTILGLKTLRNIQRVRRTVVAPVLQPDNSGAETNIRSTRSLDRQFIRILLMDISMYIIFTIMLAIVLMYQQIIQHTTMNLDQMQTLTLLRNVAVLSNYIPSCIGFYTNLIASKTFRNELKKSLFLLWR